MTNVLREVNGYELNEGQHCAKGLFNVTNPNDEVSFWCDVETKTLLLTLSDEEFICASMELISYAN